MMNSLFEALAYLCYLVSWAEFIPQIVRICRRRSSADISIPSILLENGTNLCWAAYVLTCNRELELIVTSAVDIVLCLVYTVFVIQYHGNTTAKG